jgi:hypothetical protein
MLSAWPIWDRIGRFTSRLPPAYERFVRVTHAVLRLRDVAGTEMAS